MARLFRRLFQLSRPLDHPPYKCKNQRTSADMGYVTFVDIHHQRLTRVDIFSSDPAEFSSLFQRILSMTLDTTLSPTIRIHLLSFVISAFQSLDSGIVRKECAPLVSISIWHKLSSDKVRESKLGQAVQLQKAWRAAGKRYDAADDASKARLRFEREWLYTLVLDFLNQAYNPKSKPGMFIWVYLYNIN